jgi:tRNA(fMet)-specific endonuclease VapC
VLVSAERDGGLALDRLVRDDDDVAIAAITIAEMEVGVELADEQRRKGRREFVDALIEAVSTEAYDPSVARAHAALLTHTRRTGRPRGAHDLIIAATARAHAREVVTADRDGFLGLPEVAVRE